MKKFLIPNYIFNNPTVNAALIAKRVVSMHRQVESSLKQIAVMDEAKGNQRMLQDCKFMFSLTGFYSVMQPS